MAESAVTRTWLRAATLTVALLLLLLTIQPVAGASSQEEEEAEAEAAKLDREELEKEFGDKFKGCYADEAAHPDLSLGSSNLFEMTLDKCAAWCRTKGSKFFGVRDGDTCSCGDVFGSYGMGSLYDCDNPCPGDKKQKCGGVEYNAVYTV